jgi:hypothetical protein
MAKIRLAQGLTPRKRRGKPGDLASLRRVLWQVIVGVEGLIESPLIDDGGDEDPRAPPGLGVSLVRYDCESDEDVHRRVRKALGRAPREGDVLLRVEVQHFGIECPPGPHAQDDDEVQVWQKAAR